jgi:polyferredoxin
VSANNNSKVIILTKNIKISSNRSFGVVFFLFFFILFLWPLTKGQEVKIWLFIVSVVFLGLGLINSKLLTPLNQIWFKFGILLGRFVSPVVMGAVFFAVVTPTGFIMRLVSKNFLRLKKDNNASTYWIEKKDNKTSMKNQF